MIDFVKLEVSDAIEDKASFFNQDYQVSVNTNSGVIHPKRTKKTESINISYWEYPEGLGKRVELKGSIHSYCQGGSNYQDFSFDMLVEGILQMCNNFGLNPFNCKIENLEIGLNIVPSFDLNTFIDSWYGLGNRQSIAYNTGVGKQVSTTDYRVKLYNKSKQLKLCSHNLKEIMRLELHYQRCRLLRDNFQIGVLADLLDFAKVNRLSAQLISVADRMIFHFEESPLKNSLLPAHLMKWNNPRHISYLESNNKQRFRRERREYIVWQERNNSRYLMFLNAVKSKRTNLMYPSRQSIAKALNAANLWPA